MGILFNFTREMSFREAFTVASGVIALFALYFLVIIRDPDLNKLRRGINEKIQGSQAEQAAGPPRDDGFDSLTLY
jgi:hypothetical protein